MDWLCSLAVICITYIFIASVMVYFGDCDIYLQFVEKCCKSPEELSGKVVWITGASSGIGEHLAYELAKVGCRLVLSARRENELQRVKKHCLLMGNNINEGDIMIMRLDSVEYHTHKEAVLKVLNTFKQIDILVNNAGRGQRAEWVTTSIDVDKSMFECNVLGALSLTKQVIPHMIERKEGHIVITSSLAGKLGAALLAGSYCGTKHALQGWFDALRPEVYDKNITVTSVCPGEVTTNILQNCTVERPDQILDGKMDPTKKRMSASRCAYLISVAMVNKMDEVWLTPCPGLLLLYLNQYFPNMYKLISKVKARSLMDSMREEDRQWTPRSKESQNVDVM